MTVSLRMTEEPPVSEEVACGRSRCINYQFSLAFVWSCSSIYEIHQTCHEYYADLCVGWNTKFKSSVWKTGVLNASSLFDRRPFCPREICSFYSREIAGAQWKEILNWIPGALFFFLFCFWCTYTVPIDIIFWCRVQLWIMNERKMATWLRIRPSAVVENAFRNEWILFHPLIHIK